MIIGFDGSRVFIVGRTGTENYSYQLLKALAKIDKKNTYRVYVRPDSENSERLRQPEGQNVRRSDIPDLRFSDASGIPSHSESFRVIRPSNFQFKVIPWLRLWTQGGLAGQTFRDKLDVLFVPAHTLPVVRKPGLKTVVTVHDLGSEYLPGMHQVKQRLYLGFMQRVQLKTATKIIAVSKATKEDLVKKIGIDAKKIKVIYEGYDKEKFKIQRSKIKTDQIIKKYNLMYQNYFLFVGTVQPRKNLERLIRAFAIYSSNKVRSHHKNYNSSYGKFSLRSNNNSMCLAIVGQKGWLADEIYKLPKKLGINKACGLTTLEDKVKFLGYVPDENLPALYSGASALTFPSLFEGFGLPILEAQACGCPVVTSNVSSMPEVAGSGAVYVDPYSIDDIVEGMKKVQSSKFKVQSVKAGLENVKRFSWEKCARETLEVLEAV